MSKLILTVPLESTLKANKALDRVGQKLAKATATIDRAVSKANQAIEAVVSKRTAAHVGR